MSLPSTHQTPPGPDGRPSYPVPLDHVAQTVLPTEEGLFVVHAYSDQRIGVEHVAMVLGEVSDTEAVCDGMAPLVRLHSECLTGDALGSHRCDCGDQLRAARRAIAAEGRGVVVYLRGHEGRGIGLGDKLRAYALQDGGLDTVDANLALGLEVDVRDYRAAAAILHDLGVRRVRLMSANPAKEDALRRHGVEVVALRPLAVPVRPENVSYLRTKRQRMGHAVEDTTMEQPQAWAELVAGRVPTEVGDSADAVLIERYAPIVSSRRLVVAQLGQSLDGFIAARTGDAVFVTGAADREHLHRLRALVDAVVVGVGTVVVDDCRLTVRAVGGLSPVRVLLDPTARAPRTANVLVDGAAPTLWCVAANIPQPAPPAPHVTILPLPVSHGAFSSDGVLDALARRGLRRVLVEGGGTTVSRFVADHAVDRLFVTTAPLLIGDGVPGLRFAGTDRLQDALRAPARRFVLGEDVCVELDLTGRRNAPTPNAPTP